MEVFINVCVHVVRSFIKYSLQKIIIYILYYVHYYTSVQRFRIDAPEADGRCTRSVVTESGQDAASTPPSQVAPPTGRRCAAGGRGRRPSQVAPPTGRRCAAGGRGRRPSQVAPPTGRRCAAGGRGRRPSRCVGRGSRTWPHHAPTRGADHCARAESSPDKIVHTSSNITRHAGDNIITATYPSHRTVTVRDKY